MTSTQITAAAMTTPSSLPNWANGTLPTNIMRNMTAESRNPVEKFSTKMGMMMIADTPRIHQNACLSAPRSVCIALSTCATTSTRVPFAISEGWNCIPPTAIHRLAPFVLAPNASTA